MRFRPAGFVFAVAILTVFGPGRVEAQWKPCGSPPPTAGFIISLASNGKYTLAGASEHGLFKSTDKGGSWQFICLKGDLQYINALAICDSEFIAATTYGVYVSSDQGASWAKWDSGLSNAYSINSLIVIGNRVFGAGLDGVIGYAQGDSAWTVLDEGLPAGGVTDIAYADSTLFASASDHVYKSTDLGSSWTESDSGITGQNVRIKLAAEDSVVCAVGSGIFISTDSGSLWRNVDSAVTKKGMASVVINNTVIFVSTYRGGIFRSTDLGVMWDSVNTGLPNDNVQSLASYGGSLFAGTGGDGVYRSTDAGTTWGSANDGLTAVCFNAFAIGGNTLYAGSVVSGLFSTGDAGASWNTVWSQVSAYSVFANGGDVFVGAKNGIYESTDAGISWSLIQTLFPVNCVYAIQPIGQNVYAGTLDGLFKSTDGGKTWLDPGFPHAGIRALAAKADTLYVGTTSSGVYAYNSRSGVVVDSGLAGKSVLSLSAIGGRLYAVTTDGEYSSNSGARSWATADTTVTGGAINTAMTYQGVTLAGTPGGVYLSGDGGLTWGRADSGLAGANIVSMINDGGTVFVAASGGGVWSAPYSYLLSLLPSVPPLLSPAKDTTVAPDSVTLKWNPISNVSSYEIEIAYDRSFDTLFLDSSSVTATSITVRGMLNDTTYYWRVRSWISNLAGQWSPSRSFLTGLQTDVEGTSHIPLKFALAQNYPNPFNPSTTISYELSALSHVSLKVYDVLGRLVRTLVNKVERPGDYKVEFNAADLPSGLYFYRLQAGSFSKTMKSMLLK